jgi:hypothetical protein
MLVVEFLVLTLFTAAQMKMLDKTQLDQFFDRLVEKKKGTGSLVVALSSSR